MEVILCFPLLLLPVVEAVGQIPMSMEQMAVLVVAVVVLVLVVLVELATPQVHRQAKVAMVALEHPVLTKVVVEGALPLLVVLQQHQHLVLVALVLHL